MALLPPISSDKRAIQGRNIDDEEFDLTEEINVDSSGETPERVIGATYYSLTRGDTLKLPYYCFTKILCRYCKCSSSRVFCVLFAYYYWMYEYQGDGHRSLGLRPEATFQHRLHRPFH